MVLNLKEILTIFMVLFAVIDIIGNIPIIIDLRQKVGRVQSTQFWTPMGDKINEMKKDIYSVVINP